MLSQAHLPAHDALFTSRARGPMGTLIFYNRPQIIRPREKKVKNRQFFWFCLGLSTMAAIELHARLAAALTTLTTLTTQR